MNDDNGYDEGAAGADSQGLTDTGSQDDYSDANSGTPDNQNGQQTDPRDAKISELTRNNQALNRRLVEAQRNSNPRSQAQGDQGDDYDPFSDPAGQYAISLKAATGEIYGKLEGMLSLYPELTPATAAFIRKNPWAFVNPENYQALDVKNALLDIEEYIADEVEKAGAANNQNSNQNGDAGATQQTTRSARVNPNSSREIQAQEDAENQDDWTMPLSELEKKKNKEIAKMTKASA